MQVLWHVVRQVPESPRLYRENLSSGGRGGGGGWGGYYPREEAYVVAKDFEDELAERSYATLLPDEPDPWANDKDFKIAVRQLRTEEEKRVKAEASNRELRGEIKAINDEVTRLRTVRAEKENELAQTKAKRAEVQAETAAAKAEIPQLRAKQERARGEEKVLFTAYNKKGTKARPKERCWVETEPFYYTTYAKETRRLRSANACKQEVFTGT